MTDTPKAAMIFAAGFGTRMGDLTRHTPKPMIPLAGRPMIDHAVDLVRAAGINHIVANTHYLHDVIEPHLHSLAVRAVRESPDILETGGGLKSALGALGTDPVVTLNPDAAWLGANPVSSLLKAWRKDMQALLLLVPIERAETVRAEGDFSLEQGRIRRGGGYVYTGAEILRTHRLSEIHEHVFSLNKYWDLLADSGPVHGIVYEGKWCDIGHPEGLSKAERMLADV